LGDSGVWGTELNSTLTNLDTALGGQLSLASTTFTSPYTLSSAQAAYAILIITGSPVANYTLNFSSTAFALGAYQVYNNFGSSVSVICASTGATTVTVTPGQVQPLFSLQGAITSDSDGGTF
jgi:hypothetical protein